MKNNVFVGKPAKKTTNDQYVHCSKILTKIIITRNIKFLTITLFLTRMFFLKRIFKFAQALFHSCLPFPNFFDQIMHLYMSDWVVLTNTYFKPLQKISLVKTY